MAGHTPGPWGYTYDGSSSWSVGPAEDPQVNTVASVRGESAYSRRPDRRSDDEARANARVIAAAPDLLAACKAAYVILPTGPELQLVEAAIVKAEGSR